MNCGPARQLAYACGYNRPMDGGPMKQKECTHVRDAFRPRVCRDWNRYFLQLSCRWPCRLLSTIKIIALFQTQNGRFFECISRPSLTWMPFIVSIETKTQATIYIYNACMHVYICSSGADPLPLSQWMLCGKQQRSDKTYNKYKRQHESVLCSAVGDGRTLEQILLCMRRGWHTYCAIENMKTMKRKQIEFDQFIAGTENRSLTTIGATTLQLLLSLLLLYFSVHLFAMCTHSLSNPAVIVVFIWTNSIIFNGALHQIQLLYYVQCSFRHEQIFLLIAHDLNVMNNFGFSSSFRGLYIWILKIQWSHGFNWKMMINCTTWRSQLAYISVD